MTRQHDLSRRRFLRGATAAAGLLPFVPVLDSRADAATGPKRLVIMYSPDGTVYEHWRPDSNFGFGSILEPLAAHKQELLVLEGVHHNPAAIGPGNAHQIGVAGALTATRLLDGTDFTYVPDVEGEMLPEMNVGWGGGISIDQFVAKELAAGTTYRSLEFGVQTLAHDLEGRICYAGPGEPIPPEDDPVAMFDRLFADLGLDPAQRDLLRMRRKSVLDMVGGEVSSLQARIGGADRAKLDAHLQAIRDVEQTLDGSLAGCAVPDRAQLVGGLSGNRTADTALFEAVGKAQMDLLALSMSCDLTRVATLQWSRGASLVPFDWLGLAIQGEEGMTRGGHHDLTHSYVVDPGTVGPQLSKIKRFYAQRFAYLVDAFKAIPEGEGTAFDNTVLIWLSDMGAGWGHSFEDVPIVIAAGSQTPFRTNRYHHGGGVSHNDLYVTLCHAMGLDHVSSFGDPAFNTGPMPDLI